MSLPVSSRLSRFADEDRSIMLHQALDHEFVIPVS
jgi:hypothetical protein